MSIRAAAATDFDAVLALAHEAHAASIFAALPVDESHMRETFFSALYFARGFVWVSEREGAVTGCLIGVAQPNHFGILAACDLFNYAKGGSFELLKAFRDWAEAQGAAFVQVGEYNGNGRFQRLIEHAGYQPMGRIFIRGL